jgi:hypothetical protein
MTAQYGESRVVTGPAGSSDPKFLARAFRLRRV